MNQNEATRMCHKPARLIINFVVFTTALSKGALAQNLDESGEIIRLGKTKASLPLLHNNIYHKKANLKISSEYKNKQASEIEFIRQSIENKYEGDERLQVESDDITITTQDRDSTQVAEEKSSSTPTHRWSNWSGWSKCSKTCGQYATRYQQRYCFRVASGIRARSRQCKGDNRRMDRCTDNPECTTAQPVWSEWQSIRSCPRCYTSATPNEVLRRRCSEFNQCEGARETTRLCHATPPCRPEWSAWSSWTDCSVSCNGGVRSKNRRCLSGDVEVASDRCAGAKIESEVCNEQLCSRQPKTMEGMCGNMRAVDEHQLSLASAQSKSRPQLRISNGSKTKLGQMPWQASWQFKECHSAYRRNSVGNYRSKIECKWRHVCGATLIHPSWIVTAAHCIEEIGFYVNYNNPDPHKWRIYLGRENDAVELSSQIRSPEKVKVYDGYSYKYIPVADVAMIKMKDPVVFNNYVQPACLPNGQAPAHDEDCYVSGWGYTSADAKRNPIIVERTNQLLYGVVTVANHESCKKAGRWYSLLNPEDHLCAAGAQDTCEGDSGGPLVCRRQDDPDRFYLSAVTSFSFAGCGEEGQYGIYAKVTAYEGWIKGLIAADELEYGSDGLDNFNGESLNQNEMSFSISQDDEEHTVGRQQDAQIIRG